MSQPSALTAMSKLGTGTGEGAAMRHRLGTPLGLSAEARSGSSGQQMAQDCLSIHLVLKLQPRVGPFCSCRPD